MANTSGKHLPVGVRHIQLFELDEGMPKASSATTPYNGVHLKGAKTYGFNPPEPRQISHAGDDQVLQIDFLPALQAGNAEIAVAAVDYTAVALLSGVKVFTVGEASAIALATSQQGQEPLLGAMIYQQSKDLDLGLRRWRVAILPSAQFVFLPPGMGEQPVDARYKVAPSISVNHLWGEGLTSLVEGATTSQGIELMTEGLPEIGSFTGNGTEDEFSFTHTALSTAKITIWVDGVKVTSGITKAVTKVTFDYPPASGARIIYFIEY